MEILIVMAIVAILATVVVVTLKPGEIKSKADDTQRESDVLGVMTAVQTYLAEDGHSINDFGSVGECGVNETEIGTENGNIDLASILEDKYLPNLPVDPDFGSETNTGYIICRNNTSGRITIKAPNAETKEIAVKR